jgi:hypothetical protein
MRALQRQPLLVAAIQAAKLEARPPELVMQQVSAARNTSTHDEPCDDVADSSP